MPDRDEKNSASENLRSSNQVLEIQDQISAGRQIQTEQQASRWEQGAEGQNNQRRKTGKKTDNEEDESPDKSLRQRILEKKKKKKTEAESASAKTTADEEGMPDLIFIAAILFAVVKDIVADPLSLMIKATALGIPLGLLFDWFIIPAAITIPLYVILWLGGSGGLQKQVVKRLIPYVLVFIIELIPIVKFIPATILLVIFLKITSSPMFKKIIEKVPITGEIAEKIL